MNLYGVQDTATRLTLAWSMPSRWTFQMEPVCLFLGRHLRPVLSAGGIVLEPFAGKSEWGTHRNDLAFGGIDARDWCERLAADGVRADAVLFDPPYSPRQISECYKSVGKEVTGADTQNAALYTAVRNPLAKMLKPGGIALSFGWQSSGFGCGWPTHEVLLVRHGGAHNDTICVCQEKP